MATNTISTSLQQDLVVLGTEALSESFALLSGVQMNATPDPGNKGETFNVGKYADLTTSSVTAANVSPDVDAVTLAATSISLSNFKKSAFKLTGREFQGNNLDPVFMNQVKESVRAVVYDVNATLFALYTKIPYIAGNAARSLFNNGSSASTDTLATVGKVLRTNRVPQDRWKLFISPTEEEAAKKVSTLLNANTYGSRDVVYDGYVGRALGFDIFVDQQVPTHTTGTLTNSLVTKSGSTPEEGDTTVVATTAATAGSAVAFVTGDVVTIGNYNYALTAAVSATVSADVTLTLDRGLEEDLTAGGGDYITLATGHGTGEINVAGDMTGFGLVNRIPADMFYGGKTLGDRMIVTHPSGFSIAMYVYEQYHQLMWETCALWGVNVIDSRKLCRALGA